jgi:hypothetical protein
LMGEKKRLKRKPGNKTGTQDFSDELKVWK